PRARGARLPDHRGQARLQRSHGPGTRPPWPDPPGPPEGGVTGSTFPFVGQLGAAIQAAIADPAVARRRRTRRRLVAAVSALLLLAGSLAAARLLNAPEKLGAARIGC